MENNELKQLISTFMEYRNLLTPIEQSLKQFSVSFESIGEDVKNLIKQLNEQYEDVPQKIIGAIKRSHIDNW